MYESENIRVCSGDVAIVCCSCLYTSASHNQDIYVKWSPFLCYFPPRHETGGGGGASGDAVTQERVSCGSSGGAQALQSALFWSIKHFERVSYARLCGAAYFDRNCVAAACSRVTNMAFSNVQVFYVTFPGDAGVEGGGVGQERI